MAGDNVDNEAARERELYDILTTEPSDLKLRPQLVEFLKIAARRREKYSLEELCDDAGTVGGALYILARLQTDDFKYESHDGAPKIPDDWWLAPGKEPAIDDIEYTLSQLDAHNRTFDWSDLFKNAKELR